MEHRNKEVNEKEVVDAFLDFLRHKNQGHFVLDPHKPDELERRRKAPDFSAIDSSTGMKMAIEITSLYKSSRAGYEDTIWMETVGGLDRELTGRVQGSAWVFVPGLTRATPCLENQRERNTVRTRFIQLLPSIIEAMPICDKPQRFENENIPFPFEIRKRKATGSWVAVSRLAPTSQSMDEALTYLQQVLPGKDKKFSHPNFASHEHVLLLENQIPFPEHNFAQRVLFSLSKKISLKLIDRIFLVEFDRVKELSNPWAKRK